MPVLLQYPFVEPTEVRDGIRIQDRQTTATITAEELAALIAERDALAGALRVATTERDLARD